MGRVGQVGRIIPTCQPDPARNFPTHLAYPAYLAYLPYLVPPAGPGLIGIMMCAPGVPGSISHGQPFPFSAASRWLSVDTPTESGVAFGTDITHNGLMRPGSSE